MQILYLKEVDSTQKYIKNLLKTNSKNKLPIAVSAELQTDGIGSRDNSWIGIRGNLFLSFAIPIKNLPKDLKIESASIYFSYILKDLLTQYGSNIWIKWPNHFYIDNKKIGGMITNIVDDILICGVGLNIIESPEKFSKLDIKISKNNLLEKYFMNIEKNILWKQIFSKYKLEFYKNKKYYTHNKNLKISLEDASLCDDGSIIINGERIYSLR